MAPPPYEGKYWIDDHVNSGSYLAMSRFIRVIFVLTTLLTGTALSGAANAHNNIPGDWCPAGSTVKIVGQFNYSPAQLDAYRDSQKPTCIDGTCTKDAKDCGYFDEWHLANELSVSACGDAGLQLTGPAEAIPFVVSPANFNAKEHHALYRFEQGGLQGFCAICVSDDASTPVDVPQTSKGKHSHEHLKQLPLVQEPAVR